VVGARTVYNCSVLAAVHAIRKSHVSVLSTSFAIVSILPVGKVSVGASVATILAEHFYCYCCVKNDMKSGLRIG
jgi:hypothetical protein